MKIWLIIYDYDGNILQEIAIEGLEEWLDACFINENLPDGMADIRVDF